MKSNINLDPIKGYFQHKLATFGTTPRGADWNSEQAQEMRFNQLIKIINPSRKYTLLDYGSGFGSLYTYLKKLDHQLEYYGFDIVESMVSQGNQLHKNDPDCHFISMENEIPEVDYSIVSGTFNIKLDVSTENWTDYVIQALNSMNRISHKGLAFNMLTKYSDLEYMRSNLYYADPCFFFDYCKRNFAKDVALLHDYGLYDFTIHVRKQLE